MKVVIVGLDKYSQVLKENIKKMTLRLGKLLNADKSYVEIYLVGDSFMKTNILSFSAPRNFPRPDVKRGLRTLGEIYLNPEYIKRREQNVFYMLIHGFLHLMGYDHKKNSDRMRMQKKETELCKILLSV